MLAFRGGVKRWRDIDRQAQPGRCRVPMLTALPRLPPPCSPPPCLPLLLLTPAGSQPELAAASDWLAFVDAGAGTSARCRRAVRAQMPQSMWEYGNRAGAGYHWAGAVPHPTGTTRTRSPPGAPDGDYIVIELDPLLPQARRQWKRWRCRARGSGLKVDGYFIR